MSTAAQDLSSQLLLQTSSADITPFIPPIVQPSAPSVDAATAQLAQIAQQKAQEDSASAAAAASGVPYTAPPPLAFSTVPTITPPTPPTLPFDLASIVQPSAPSNRTANAESALIAQEQAQKDSASAAAAASGVPYIAPPTASSPTPPPATFVISPAPFNITPGPSAASASAPSFIITPSGATTNDMASRAPWDTIEKFCREMKEAKSSSPDSLRGEMHARHVSGPRKNKSKNSKNSKKASRRKPITPYVPPPTPVENVEVLGTAEAIPEVIPEVIGTAEALPEDLGTAEPMTGGNRIRFRRNRRLTKKHLKKSKRRTMRIH